MAEIKLVYVAGPYRAPLVWQRHDNIHAAWRASVDVAACGAMPVVPHMCSMHLDGVADDEFWLAATMQLMRRCDAVFLKEGWQRSSGSRAEKAEAERLGLPVFETISELRVWVKASEAMAAALASPTEAKCALCGIKADPLLLNVCGQCMAERQG